MKQHPHITDPTRYIFSEAGIFLKTLVKEINLAIKLICQNIHISTKSFYPVIRGIDKEMGYYVTLLYYLVETKHGDDEVAKKREYHSFIELVVEGVRKYLVVHL